MISSQTLLIILAILLALDMASTIAFLKVGVQEGNPLVARLINLLGPVGALTVLKIGTFVVIAYLWKLGSFEGDMIWLLVGLDAFYVGVVAWNVKQLRKASKNVPD